MAELPASAVFIDLTGLEAPPASKLAELTETALLMAPTLVVVRLASGRMEARYDHRYNKEQPETMHWSHPLLAK